MYNLKSVEDTYIENYGLIVRMSKRYYTSHKDYCKRAGITVEDLISESYFAVKSAIEAYDESKGYKLQTYFTYQIKRRFNRLVGIQGKKEMLNQCISLESTISDDEESTLMDLIADKYSNVPFEKINREDYLLRLKNDINREILYLPKEEGLVINFYYLKNKTMDDIAIIMGISSANVKAILARGLNKLRKPQCSLGKYRQDLS